MPTIFIYGPLRFFFYSNEESRMHVHVEHDGNNAKVWMDNFEIASSKGFSQQDLKLIQKLVRKNEEAIKRKWKEHFKID